MLLGGALAVALAPAFAPLGGCDSLEIPGDAGEDAPEKPPRVGVCDQPGAPDVCTAALAEPDASVCAGGRPDGRCVPALEGCACEDCAQVALCLMACVDDTVCDLAAGEDCTCADCDGKVNACSRAVGCRDNGICSPLEDDCTCADCQGDRDCQACVDNGECVDYTEGCSCADCAPTQRCQPDGGLPDGGDLDGGAEGD